MNIKLPLSIIAVIIVLTIIFSYIFSTPKSQRIYDDDILLTMYENYFEVEGCRVHEEDCRAAAGEHYIDKKKHPSKYHLSYKTGLAPEVKKLMENGKKIHLRIVDVSTGDHSAERIKEIKDLLKDEDTKIEIFSMNKHK